ncbi:hypothetical protein [Acinetobacter baumannii]|uniref:hypothetical protein n=1 Tax=Acinetobacter baumannii TaxID=470 RepID=UPI0007436E70
MNERPILFNTEMVRAILEGRKTQTRRLVKEKLISEQAEFESGNRPNVIHSEPSLKYYIDNSCPFGQVGDHLWVRETFSYALNEDDHICDKDGNSVWDVKDAHIYFAASEINVEGKWMPSIHMPRWASRFSLEITNIRVERLNELSEADAIEEGVEPIIVQDNVKVGNGWAKENRHMWKGYKNKARAYQDTAKDSFNSLWESINGDGSWDLNPWVWVIEFRVIQGGRE